jgi:hypothetical protein
MSLYASHTFLRAMFSETVDSGQFQIILACKSVSNESRLQFTVCYFSAYDRLHSAGQRGKATDRRVH